MGGMSRHSPGTSPRRPSQAAGSPISYVAALAWCPTVRRGTDDCGEHHPSPAATLATRRGCAASGKTPYRRKGIPRVRRGVGYVGDWRFARPLSEPPGVPTRWGSRAWLNLQVGPPLGALRRWLRGARAPDPARRRRSGECSGGKQMWPAARPAHAGRAARPRGPRARRPSNLVDSTALKHGRQALTGAR